MCVNKQKMASLHHTFKGQALAITRPEWGHGATRGDSGSLVAAQQCPLVRGSCKDRSNKADCLWSSLCLCDHLCVCVCPSVWSDRRCPCCPTPQLRPQAPCAARGTPAGHPAGSGRCRPGCEVLRIVQGSPANQWPESVGNLPRGRSLGGWTSNRRSLWRGM